MKKLTAIVLVLIGTVLLSLCVCAQPDGNNFHVTVFPDEHAVNVTWENYGVWDSSSLVAVSVFEDDGTQPASFNEYGADTESVTLPYNAKATTLRVELAVNYNTENVLLYEKNIDVAKAPISVADGQYFNSTTFSLDYFDMEEDVVTIFVNGASTQKAVTQSGSLKIQLDYGENDFGAYVDDKEQGITWEIQRKITVDKTPPVLKMSKDYDGMVTDFNNVTVSGIVYDCDNVTVNGIDAKLDQNGMFSAKVPLKKGDNTLTVLASDVCGNQTLYTACVKCGKLNLNSVENKINADKAQKMNFDEILVSTGSFWALVISGVLCVAVVVYAFVFWRKEGK